MIFSAPVHYFLLALLCEKEKKGRNGELKNVPLSIGIWMRISLFGYFKTTLLRILQKTLEFLEVTSRQHHAAAATTTTGQHQQQYISSSIYKILTFRRKYLIFLEPLILLP